jgi:asparagine synthase (glutamine-hydrolysing)
LSGEISDELFGYKYTDYAPSAQAFHDESLKRLRELYQYDVLRADRCIAAWSLGSPGSIWRFELCGGCVGHRSGTKTQHAQHGQVSGCAKPLRKGIFLPQTILWRDKAAFSDAVGHSMVDALKAAAEARNTRMRNLNA